VRSIFDQRNGNPGGDNGGLRSANPPYAVVGAIPHARATILSHRNVFDLLRFPGTSLAMRG